jgi:hypothetical protein
MEAPAVHTQLGHELKVGVHCLERSLQRSGTTTRAEYL